MKSVPMMFSHGLCRALCCLEFNCLYRQAMDAQAVELRSRVKAGQMTIKLGHVKHCEVL